MKKQFIIFIFLLSSVTSLCAQQLDQLVTLNYDKEPLGDVLQDISRRYEVFFSYSADFIPVHRLISISVNQFPLGVVLDELFEASPIIYKAIAGQIVLRVDRGKQDQLDALAMERRKRVFLESKETPIAPLPRGKQAELPGGNRIIEIPVVWLEPRPYKKEVEKAEDEYKVRIGLLSFFKEKSDDYKNEVNDLSINILWGESGNVNGMEVGGLVNKTHHNVKGVQVAGISNIIGDNLIGTQVGGLGNVVGGNVNGVQATLGFNLVEKDVKGVQIAGVFNCAFGQSDALQIAGLFNHSEGSAKWQIATIYNRADTVKKGQISLINIGKRVNGIQVGLLNFADTTSNISIGLLNINKHGYNRIEFSGGDALHANIAFKPGVAAFYNILHAGTAWNRTNNTPDGYTMSWGLGYGFGSSIKLGKKTHLNIEALATHINEDSRGWTNKLNLLNQLRVSFEISLGKRTSFFFGPTGYLMLSHLKDSESSTRGSIITPQKLLWESNKGITNSKAWVGFNAGLRF